MKWLLVVCVLGGVLLRGIESERKSLWLDELHTLYIADSDGLGEVVAKVSEDFHPPLYFWALSFVEGTDPNLQRWFSIILSLLTLLPLWAVAREGGMGTLARICMCGVLLFVPYQVQYGAELRSYSALQLASATLLWAAMTTRASPRTRFVTFVLATGIGLYTHYFTAIAVVGVGAAHLLARPAGSLSRLAVLGAGTLGVALFMPWVLTVEGWIFTETEQFLPAAERAGVEAHDPSTAGVPREKLEDEPAQAPWWSHDLKKAGVALPRTLVPTMWGLGESVQIPLGVAVVTMFAAILTAACALFWQILRRRPAGERTLWCAVVAGSVCYLITISLGVVIWRSVRLQYLMVAAWIWPVFIGLAVDRLPTTRMREVVAGLFLPAAFVAGLCHSLGESREDTERGLEVALERAREHDALLTSVLWQPGWYPNCLPYTYCMPEVDCIEPTEIPSGAEGRAVVVVTRKSEHWSQPKYWEAIRTGRFMRSIDKIDFATRVYVFEPHSPRKLRKQ